jgi:predicted Zn-dependent peptidase
MLIIVGDVDEATVRKVLLRYLGGFRTQRGSAPRKSLRYQPRPGTVTETEAGGSKGVYVRLDAEYPLSGINYATVGVAVEALRRELVRALDGTGMSVEITTGFHTYPQERLWMFLSCEGGTDLEAVRQGIRAAAVSTLSAKDLNALKAMALAGINRELAEPETIVSALVARYGVGKDLVTHYKENVDGVTAARVTELLSTLAAGSTAEIVVE